MNGTYDWIEFEFRSSRSVPKWARRVAVASNGTVFVPGLIAGNPTTIFICASCDGTAALVAGNHAYYPADWIAREFPKAAEAVRHIETMAREFMKSEATTT